MLAKSSITFVKKNGGRRKSWKIKPRSNKCLKLIVAKIIAKSSKKAS